MATAAEKKQELAKQESTQTQMVTSSRNKVTDFSLGIFGTSDNFIMAGQMAKAEGWVDKNGSKWKTMPQVMLRYRAASFFSRMNCPELTLGLYSKEEIIDGDFKEYPIEDMAEQVKRDIEENANSEFFEPEVAETVEEPKAAEPKKAEGEVVEDEDLPNFMK